MPYLDWIATALTLFGMFLLARKNSWAWSILIFGNAAWIIYWSTYPNQYAAVILNAILGAVSCYGWWKWKQARRADPWACPRRVNKTNHFYDEYSFDSKHCVYCGKERSR